jgi:hypothetical protein
MVPPPQTQPPIWIGEEDDRFIDKKRNYYDRECSPFEAPLVES